MLTTIMRLILTRSLKPFEFKSKYRESLDFKDLKNMGLYVHIPFCRSLCSFCPYCKEIYSRERAESYKEALLKEIELVCSHMDRKKEVTSLYFGGGTPALMIDDLEEIVGKLKEYFEIIGGIGLEFHPSDISKENIIKLKAAGFTMVSVGLQSFDENCLQKLGRSGGDFADKLKLLKGEFEALDVDLIFAIPGQTEATLLSDVDKAFEYGATQVSTYPFIDFTFANNEYKPMDEDVKKNMLLSLVYHGEASGFERTSVWTFAKKGTEKYSSVTRDSFLGFGVSATTLLKQSFKVNTFSIDGYIERVERRTLPTALTIDFTERQRAAYHLFWSAYAMKLDAKSFEDAVGRKLEEMYGIELKLAEKLGYIKKAGENYELTEKSTYLYHKAEQIYTNAYIDKMWSLLRVEPFPEKMTLK